MHKLLWFLTTLAAAQSLEEQGLRELLQVRRVYVDRLTGGETAAQMREILISSLQSARLFVVTEKEDRADTVLKGGSEDLVFSEVHSSSDSINAHFSGGTTRTSKQSGNYVGGGAGESESSHSAERRHEAIAAVRLVNKDGDVIWSTTQESLGGKFRGSSADVADKITKALVEDYAKARKLKQ